MSKGEKKNKRRIERSKAWRQLERDCQGELPFSIDVKEGKKEKKHEDRGSA